MACGCEGKEKKNVRISRAKLPPAVPGQKSRLYTVHLTDAGEPFDMTTESLSSARETAGRYGAPLETWGSPMPRASIPRRPGRYLSTDDMVGEPLLALAEGMDHDVIGCCESCPDTTSTVVPHGILFEDVKRTAEGFAFEPRRTKRAPEGFFELPKKFVQTMERAPSNKLPVCLPFVRIARDPRNFRDCLRQARAIGPLTDSKRIYQLVSEWMVKQDQEVFLVILCDTQMQVRGVTELARGARDRVNVPVPDVLRIVIVEGATTFIVVHNHPSGRVDPSDADKSLTESIQKAGRTVNLELMDHVIVGATGYWSFHDHRLL